MKQVSENVTCVQSTINELKCSLEYTQKDVEDLKQELKKHEQDKKDSKEIIKTLKEDLQESGKIIKELEDRVNYQEDYNRRKNLQIIGIEENPEGETWEQTAVKVSNLLEDKLQLPDIQLERAHRVGQLQRDDPRGRPVIARFSRYGDREAVMRNVTKLRGTRIFINEDLCPASLNIKKAQLPLLKQARDQGKIAYFRNTKLIIKERPNVAHVPGRAGTPRYGASTLHETQTRPSARGDVSGGADVVDGSGGGVAPAWSTTTGASSAAVTDAASAGAEADSRGVGGRARPDRRNNNDIRTTRNTSRGGKRGQ